MREMKFRCYNKASKKMHPINDLSECDHLAAIEGLLTNIDLMQYTGLKDKKGKEIYEGDILSYDKKDDCFKDWPKNQPFPIGEVVWLKDEAGFGWLQEDDGYESIIKDHVIIGNIYENPELIKE